MNSSLASRVMEWSKPVIAVFNLLFFAIALYLTYMSKSDQNFSLLIGAVISNATTVINYFFGSSSGSQKKDDVIASVATGNPTPPIVPPGTPPAPPAP